MQAYATSEMPSPELRLLEGRAQIPNSATGAIAADGTFLDQLVGQLADLVAAKVADRLSRPQTNAADGWMDTRRAAEYLGIHRDSLRRLAAERTIPAEQAGAGCKLFFRRSDLDAWRDLGPGSVVGIRSRRNG